jgi:signal transduction histidine kinase/DNA-binding response OmpR family regulator/HPt (histidine-containing phosphotransfer) domain-containing protein
MPMMIRSFARRTWKTIRQNAQVLIVCGAFALMVILSNFFVGGIVRKQLVREAEASLTFMQTKIEADLQEPHTLMLSISETIRGMILLGYDPDVVHKYIQDISNSVIKNERRPLGSNGLYGVFHAFGDLYLNDNTWLPPEGYVPTDRPWYKAAIETKGEVALTQPYLDARTGNVVLSCVRSVSDEEGNTLCVLALDVPLGRIANDVVSTRLAEGGYGLLFDSKLNVIAHPDPMGLGKPLREWNSGLASLVNDLEKAKSVSERKLRNFMDIETIVFVRIIKNEWFVGIVTPYDKYYQDVVRMRTRLILVGFALAVSLSFVFLRISSAKTKAEAKNQQKSNFLARMSHEIRTPMNAVLGIAEIQLQSLTLSQSVREAFLKISNSGDLLIGIINDILDLSKIEAGKLELTPAAYDVPSLINDTVQLNILRFESKPIEFKLSVDENVPVSLIGDELRIKQILNNLLSNAFKYTEKGEVSFSIAVDYAPRGGAIHVPLVFRVNDTGQGMTAEQIRKLGDEYSRFNMEANRTTEGTGLGMSITLKLIQMMNGKFSVESKVGKGTTVTVRLPQRNVGIGVSGMIGKELAEDLQKSRMHSVSQMKKVQITRTPMPYGKVLIVDDVESNLFVAKGLMAPYGLSIETVTSGFAAIEKIKSGEVYDIVFMDHMMPKMDGIETTNIIRKLGYQHAIVALTANALTGQAEMFMENGFDGFLSKPIDIRQLNASLNKLIRDKQPPEVIAAAWRQKGLDTAADGMPGTSLNPQLAEIFVHDAERAIGILEAIHANKIRRIDDVQMYVINVHSMKSALANIGETELSDIAQKLELAVRGGNTDVITDETLTFLDLLRNVIEKIRPKENDEGGEITDEDSAYLNQKLSDLQTVCVEYDKKSAKEIMAELRQKTWPHPVKELLDNISGHLLHSDFEEAAKLAKDYSHLQAAAQS